MNPVCRVVVAANFERNLSEIESFLVAAGAPEAFHSLVSDLFDQVIPNIERFPEMGRDFLGRRARSMQTIARLSRVHARIAAGARLREYIASEYLVLYEVREDRAALLAIRHHRQLSYDLPGHW